MTGRRPYSRHGLNALKARVKVRGLGAIDRRTAEARGLLDFRRDLLADLGGAAAVSAGELALVEMAVRTRLFVDHVDAFLLDQDSLVNRKRRALYPVLRERQALVDSLARILGTLGLERRAQPKQVDVAALLAGRRNGGAGHPETPPTGQAAGPAAGERTPPPAGTPPGPAPACPAGA